MTASIEEALEWIPSASRRHGSLQWSCSGQDVLANRSSDRCTENSTYAQAIALTELIVYIILDFANGPSQLLYPVFILSLIALNIVWLRYFLYKSPYKRLELFAEAVPKSPARVRTSADTKLQGRVVRGDKNSIQTATYLKGGTLREKEIFAQALSEFFAPIENQRYI